MVGDGPERGPVERLAHELGVKPRVRFMGKQDQKDAQASKDVIVLKDELKKATDALKEQQKVLVRAYQETAAAQRRQSAISERTEMQFQQQEKLE